MLYEAIINIALVLKTVQKYNGRTFPNSDNQDYRTQCS